MYKNLRLKDDSFNLIYSKTFYPFLNLVLFIVLFSLILGVSSSFNNVGTTFASSEIEDNGFLNETYLENPTEEELYRVLANGIPLSSYTTPKSTDITISPGNWTMEDLHEQFPEEIKKTGIEGGITEYYVNNSIVIEKDTTLDIFNSKILLRSNSIRDNDPARIISYGNTTIFNSTIMSWDPQNNMPDPNPYHPRSFLVARDGGIMNILNSTISYLGFSQGGILTIESSLGALNYYNTSEFVIANSTISHNLYGFYSQESYDFRIVNNKIFDQIGYGLDPHSGSRDFIIDSNHIFVSGGQGIICSHQCKNVTITNNLVEYNNQGIGLHWLTNSSTIKDNIVKYNKSDGIFIKDRSYDNLIENNTVVGNTYGIRLYEDSNDNTIINNDIRYNILDEDSVTMDETSQGNFVDNNG